MEIPQHTDEWLLSPEYAFTKANLAYFLPELLPQAEELYRELLKQQQLFKDQFELNALDIPYEVRGTGNFSEQLKKGPFIFVSYHMGPIGTLFRHLSKLDIHLTLLFDTGYYNKWADRYRAMYQEFLVEHKSNQTFEIVNTETLEGGVKIAKALMNGSSLLLFVDGNTGVGGARRQDEKLSRVSFFGRKIVTRRGIAHLSRRFNVPVVPVVSYYEKQDEAIKYFLEFSDPVLPETLKDETTSDADLSQRLYARLEQFVRRYPDQWAAWLYVHLFIDRTEIKEEDFPAEPKDLLVPLQFNAERFSFILHEGNYFLFNHSDHQHQPITTDVYTYLATFRTPQIAESNVSPDSILQLLKKGILVKA